MPVRSFRTTFSHFCASAPTCDKSASSSVRPAVFSRWLWQATQLRARNSRSAAGCAAADGAWASTNADGFSHPGEPTEWQNDAQADSGPHPFDTLASSFQPPEDHSSRRGPAAPFTKL